MALQQDTKKKTAVLAFGRMNPPTTGHEAMIKKTHAVAKQHGGTAHIVASHSQDKDNPLPQDKKLGYIRKIAHPDVNVSGSSKEHPSIMHAAAKLHAAGHTHLHVVSDKHKEFHNTLNKYNNKKGPHGHYNFKSITTSDSGKRDPKASGVTGISGTKMRDYSRSGQHDKFKAGLPKALHPHAKEIHGHIGGTQLESFKEASNNKKKFKPSGKKTEVILHAMPTADRSDKSYGLNGSGKGAPANTTRAGGTRFGEHRVDNRILAINSEFESFIGDQLDEELLSKEQARKNQNAIVNKAVASVRKKEAEEKARIKKVTDHVLKKKSGGTQLEEIDPEINEVLSRQARIKRALMLRRFKHKIQRRKKMMRGKLATKEMLHRRARRHAVKLVRKRFMGKKGENYAKLGMADKIMIDTKLATKRKIIDRIAGRLLPKVRRAELVRLRNMKKGKQEPKVIKKTIPQKPVSQAKWKAPEGTTKSSVASYRIPVNVKTEGYITEDNIFEIVDSFNLLTEKDMVAVEKKIDKTDIDSNILFEAFLMGLNDEGDQSPQQKGFQSLNTFIAGVDKQLSEAMSNWDDNPITGVQLDRRYNRPMVAKSTLPRLKEFKATGEDSSVEDPIDPKTVKHDVIDKNKKKKNGKIESLSYPHDTAKAYKRDTPGQNEEKNCGCGQDPCITYGKKDTPKQQDETSIRDVMHNVNYKAWEKKELIKRKARQLKSKMNTQKPAFGTKPGSTQLAHYDMNAMFEAMLNKGGVQNEDVDVNRDPNHAHIKKMGYKVQHGHGLNAKDPRHKQNHSKPDVTLHYTMGDTDSSAYTVHKGGAAHGDPKMHRVAKPKTKVGGVQNEDAAAMMRVARAQEGQKERLRARHEREMEQMDNSEEKKKKREAFTKSMQGLKVRQQARRDQARARLPTGLRTNPR